MKKKADILVVTATLGDRDTLSKTIDSVKAIGGDRVRHIIVAPLEKCDKLRLTYSEIDIIPELADCRGIYSALNYALSAYCRDYNYLTYINDDDFWLPNFSKLFEIIDKNPKIDGVYGRTMFIDSHGRKIKEQTSSSRYKMFGALLKENIVLFTQQATLIKRDLYLKMNGFDESFRLAADTKFWLDSINDGAIFHYVDSICSAYTLQEDQLSSDKTLQRDEHERIFKSIASIDKWKTKKEKYLFRISNFFVYISNFTYRLKK